MNEKGSFVASLLDASSKAYAAGTVLRLQESGPEGARIVERWGFGALVDDVELRLRHLAEALACGRPELFAQDVQWLAATHAARALPDELLASVLACLRAELQDSLPGDAAAQAAVALEAGIQALEGAPPAVASLLEEDAPHVEVARRFLLAVLEGDRSRAESVLFEALDGGLSVADLHQHVVGRVQAEVGRMWQTGEVNVAGEHFGSRIVEDVLARVRGRLPRPADSGRSVLTASVPGDLHDIGARIVADQFEMEGWRSVFLGANVPTGDLVQAVRDFDPDLVALSVGLVLNLRSAARTIEALREAFPDKPILIGGRPFTLVPELWKDVGADGCATDAAEAVRTGERLVPAA